MKSFLIYRDIRKKALIFGLDVGRFAIQASSVITTLLLIIFSFNLWMFFMLVFWNLGLYVFLLRTKRMVLSTPGGAKVKLLSNKQIGINGSKD